MPPLDADDPAAMLTLPLDDDPKPTAIVMDPADPLTPLPVVTDTSPLDPTDDDPDPTCTAPLLPFDASPVVNTADPVDEVPAPLEITTEPL
jgi:hypothetical protein